MLQVVAVVFGTVRTRCSCVGSKTLAANSSCHCSPCWQQGVSGRDEFLSPELSSSVPSPKDATTLASGPRLPKLL